MEKMMCATHIGNDQSLSLPWTLLMLGWHVWWSLLTDLSSIFSKVRCPFMVSMWHTQSSSTCSRKMQEVSVNAPCVWQARWSSLRLCIALDSLDLELHLPYSDWWQILFQWPNSKKVPLKLFLSRPHPLASVSCSKNPTKSVKWESPHPWYLTTLNIRSNSLFLSFNIWSPRSPSAQILLCWFSKNATTLEIFSTNLDTSIHQLPNATHSTLRL